MSVYTEIYRQAKKLEPQIADFLSRLVQTPSFSMKEQDVVQVIKAEMEKIGFDDIWIDALGSIIGWIGNGPRLIAFDAHIDTVYPGNADNWETPPFSGIIKDGYVHGRGTADQKGGLASMIYAAKLIKELDLNHNFTILFTGTVMEEDCDGIAWEHLITEDNVKPELVVSTEPTSLNIYRGHRGRMEMTAEIRGTSCHGSAPERGDNAIYKMARFALEVEKLNERLANDSFLGKGTITASIMKSDSPSQCAVADYAFLQVDRRLTQGETKELAVEQLQECATLAGVEALVKVLRYEEKAYTGKQYPVEKYYPTWVLHENSQYIKAADTAFQSIFNKKPIIDKWTFSTNCVFIMGKHPHIKCMGFGPGDEDQAHAPNERIKVSDLGDATAFYAALVAQLDGVE
ncbi:MAG: YgeY family selenium metabolism-linked hydrolase [Candidatus Cloacimonetes bacterium]|nr:YgeY family selenium metabolism-linked hydrolase [Candidatus Cloacimonadota bacterium]